MIKSIFIYLFILMTKISGRLFSYFYRFKYFAFVTCLGNVRIGKRFKVRPIGRAGVSLKIVFEGNNAIGDDCCIQGSGKISFGENSYCGDFCIFGVNESVIIGKNVLIAQMVTIRDTNHNVEDTTIPINAQGINMSPVEIRDDVWIGHGVTILKGVTIGEGAVIAAGSVVTKNVEEYMVYAGIPAKPIKSRKAEKVNISEIKKSGISSCD